MDIATTVHRIEDPMHYVCEEVVRRSTNRKMRLLTDVVMASLPSPLPPWAVTYTRAGIQLKLKATLKRLGFVFRDGRYQRFAEMTTREAWVYISQLEESSDRDRARIKHLKATVRQAEKVAGTTDSPRAMGDLLGWSEEDAA